MMHKWVKRLSTSPMLYVKDTFLSSFIAMAFFENCFCFIKYENIYRVLLYVYLKLKHK